MAANDIVEQQRENDTFSDREEQSFQMDNSEQNDTNDEIYEHADRSDVLVIDGLVSNDDVNRNIIGNSKNSSIVKGRRRKRHHNLSKNNKKWNKQFKRQKSHLHVNNNADLENVMQNGRNKHLYGSSKVSKLLFNKSIGHRGGISGISKFFLPDKRPRKNAIIPPTKFLLGGNISDPLNLNSLQDEALASMNAATPKSSPITTPPKVEVIIPPNICDPLHLLDPVDSIEYEKQLISPMKQRKVNKNRYRKKKPRKYSTAEVYAFTESGTSEAALTANDASIASKSNSEQDSGADELFVNTDDEDKGATEISVPGEKCAKEKVNRELHLDLSAGSAGKSTLLPGHRKRKVSESNTNPTCKTKLRRMDSMDKIVSPVIPQPGAWKRPPKLLPMGAPRNTNRAHSTSLADDAISPTEELNLKKCFDVISEPRECASDDGAGEIVTTLNAVVSATLMPMPSTSDIFIAPENVLPDEQMEKESEKPVTFKKENIRYQYGNFTGRYTGIQGLMNFADVRLTVFMRHAYLFKDKDILDIGCSVGHLTFAIARKLHPKSIVGIDIDKNLIARARHNLSLFVRIPNLCQDIDNITTGDVDKNNGMQEGSSVAGDSVRSERRRSKGHRNSKRVKYHERNEFFPLSFPICYGGIPLLNNQHKPVTAPSASITATDNATVNEMELRADSTIGVSMTNPLNLANQTVTESLFPSNVSFRTLNYVVADETQMNSDGPQYDLILCLSVTKWIHLNFGDQGLKMTFRRMFNQLRPGGKLILEAQNWASYKKKKKLTETIYNNYKNIEFFPNKFHEYLLSPEVGFSHSYALGIPRHASKGFYRPIQLYIKGDFTPSQVRWSDSYHPQTPYEPYRYYFPRRKSSIWGSGAAHTNIGGASGSQENPYAYSNRLPSSTSQYYNPLETDSYLPSYDNEIQTRHYCFASPLYSTIWSPPSGRKSASQTPLFGSIRRVDEDSYINARRHVYHLRDDGGSSTRSIDDGSCSSPQTNHVYAIGSSRSVREVDLDVNTNSPKAHVYAVSSPCNDNSSSPRTAPVIDAPLESPTNQYSGESSRSVDVEPDESILNEDFT